MAALREGEPEVHGGLRLWSHFGRGRGADAISLRILELGSGSSSGFANTVADEIFYVLEGDGIVTLDGHAQQVGPDTGFYLRPDSRLTIDNPGPASLLLASSRCPDPGTEVGGGRLDGTPPPEAAHPRPFVRLRDRAVETTADRWYSVLVDEKLGSTKVTQFVGAIPRGRAPDHYHHYEEVVCILAGRGRMWAGSTSTSIEPGSCIYLPRGQVHCLENTGDAELRLLGVFYPAGSPAVRYETG